MSHVPLDLTQALERRHQIAFHSFEAAKLHCLGPIALCIGQSLLFSRLNRLLHQLVSYIAHAGR